MTVPDLLEIRALAEAAAKVASEAILSAFRTREFWTRVKSDGSPVTKADVEAEKAIRNFLASATANAWPIAGEEFGEIPNRERYRWLIDPIDGTLSFMTGLPTFGTIVAFEDRLDEQALVGVIHLPAFGDTYVAARGHGAFCNGKPISVALPRPLRECIISTPDAIQFRLSNSESAYQKVRAKVDQLRGYTDCWAHAMVASGSFSSIRAWMTVC